MIRLELENPPEDLLSLRAYVNNQFQRLVAQLNQGVDSVQLDIAYKVPAKPRVGMLVYADGTKWNPGSGEGLYVWKSDAAWHHIV